MRLGEVGKGTWVGRGVQLEFSGWARGVVRGMVRREDFFFFFLGEIGRASCRERVF